jgi:hypothetical protein
MRDVIRHAARRRRGARRPSIGECAKREVAAGFEGDGGPEPTLVAATVSRTNCSAQTQFGERVTAVLGRPCSHRWPREAPLARCGAPHRSTRAGVSGLRTRRSTPAVARLSRPPIPRPSFVSCHFRVVGDHPSRRVPVDFTAKWKRSCGRGRFDDDVRQSPSASASRRPSGRLSESACESNNRRETLKGAASNTRALRFARGRGAGAGRSATKSSRLGERPEVLPAADVSDWRRGAPCPNEADSVPRTRATRGWLLQRTSGRTQVVSL